MNFCQKKGIIKYSTTILMTKRVIRELCFVFADRGNRDEIPLMANRESLKKKKRK